MQVYQGMLQGHLAGPAVLSFVVPALVLSQCHGHTLSYPSSHPAHLAGWAATWCPGLCSLTCLLKDLSVAWACVVPGLGSKLACLTRGAWHMPLGCGLLLCVCSRHFCMAWPTVLWV
jgi:hypothetical protein